MTAWLEFDLDLDDCNADDEGWDLMFDEGWDG